MDLLLPDGKATSMKKAFSRETPVTTAIKADKENIWNLLTNASKYARLNSTIISISGKIAKDKTINAFKLKIKEFDVNKRMVWGDAMGTRVYLLEDEGNLVKFTITEKIGGLVFPLFAKMIPPFEEAFERFARDLKIEAEIIMNKK